MKYNITIKKYNYNSFVVKHIKKLIKKKYKDLFFAVIVHGSIATNEIIEYSDFDGLIILKDKYIKSRMLKSFIKDSMKIIYKFDPLQHHGWFIIYESQLKNYPQTYFPYELFNYARVIYPEHDIEFNIHIPEDVDYILPFKKLSNSILTKLERGYRPKNMYQLKGLLSEFMLLPALYIQAKEKRGIFKKYSFELAKRDFSKDEWEIMNLVSKIRLEWHSQLNIFQRWFMSKPYKFFRKITKKYIAPSIPENISKYLTSDFYNHMIILTRKMVNNVKKN